MKDGEAAIYDNGFYNIGVRPTAEDIGLGGTDPYGVPLSFTKQWVTGQRVDKFKVTRASSKCPSPARMPPAAARTCCRKASTSSHSGSPSTARSRPRSCATSR